MDLEALKAELRDASPEDVDAVRIAAISEQERRANLEAIPEQIEQLTRVYRDGGGDEQTLADALTPEQVAALEA